MRNDNEILERIEVVKKLDLLGLSIQDLILRLSYEAAKDAGLVKEGCSKEEWEDGQPSAEPDAVKGELCRYLEFAWEKSIGHRGISAGRSINHIQNWLWLIGDDEGLAFAEDDRNYPQYGAPILKFVSDRYGYDYPRHESAMRMARGESCVEGCDMGCGE